MLWLAFWVILDTDLGELKGIFFFKACLSLMDFAFSLPGCGTFILIPSLLSLLCSKEKKNVSAIIKLFMIPMKTHYMQTS